MAQRRVKRRIEYIAIDVLPPADRNAKGHDDALIGASMDRFGFIEPCLLDERTHQLVAGHGRRERLIAKRDAGEEPPEGIVVRDGAWTVPVVRGWSSADDAEAEAAGLALNQATIAGGWDSETLAAMLADLAQSARGFDGTGFGQSDLNDLLHQIDVRAKRDSVDPDEIPPEPAKPITRSGDLWIMGDHRLLCGDSTKLEDVRRALDGQPIDFAFTSPPYNVGVDYDNNENDQLPWDMYEKMLREVVTNVVSELAPGRFLGWNVGVTRRIRPWTQCALVLDAGLEFYRQLIWDKVGVGLPTYYRTRDDGRTRVFHPNINHEYVWLFVKGKPEPGGTGDYDEGLLRDDILRIAGHTSTKDLWTEPGSNVQIGTQSSLRVSGGSVGKPHPAPFPVALPQGFIGYLADRDAIVFDPFAGAGSTIIAAHRMGRRGVGVELSPRYCDVIAERYQRVTEQLPILERTGKPVDFLARRAKAEAGRS